MVLVKWLHDVNFLKEDNMFQFNPNSKDVQIPL